MWEYNQQNESAKGCWHKSICAEQSYWMFDGRMIQFFCDEEAYGKIGDDFGTLAYPIWPAEEQHWEFWEPACNFHDECRMRNGKSNQHCTFFLWEPLEDGEEFGNGTACYGWGRNRCESDEPEETFAISNENYGTTKFSFYTQLWCMGPDWDFGMEPMSDWGDEDASWDDEEMWHDDGLFTEDRHDEDRDRDGSDDERRGGGDDMMIDGARFAMRMEEDRDGSRLEIIMGATKLAATAASAAVAASLY